MGLSYEAVVSVADSIMDENGHRGRVFRTEEEASAYLTPLSAAAGVCNRSVGGRPAHAVFFARNMQVWGCASEKTHGVTSDFGAVVLHVDHTDELTLLHEFAHLKTPGEGHGPAFMQAAYELYYEHLGAEAARIFKDIVEAPHNDLQLRPPPGLPAQDTLFGAADSAPPLEQGAAHFSADRMYRYDLTRSWDTHPTSAIQWVMLNPSVGNEMQNDHTLRRCIAYSKRWGYDHMFVNNLFAYVSTDQNALLQCADPVGPDNDEWIARRSAESETTVVAWGTGPRRGWIDNRVAKVLSLLESPMALRVTNGGMPAHPLRLAAALEPRPFSLIGHDVHLSM